MLSKTVRNKLLEFVIKKLPNIKVENGYNNSIAKVRAGFFKSKAVTEFPTVCVYYGTDIQAQNIEGEFTGVNTIDLMILVYLNSTIEEQSSNAELMIEDLHRFFGNDESINPDYSINLMDVKYVQDYVIAESEPYLTGDNNILAIGMIIKVEYINFLDQLMPYTPVLMMPVNNSSNIGNESNIEGGR